VLERRAKAWGGGLEGAASKRASKWGRWALCRGSSGRAWQPGGYGRVGLYGKGTDTGLGWFSERLRVPQVSACEGVACLPFSLAILVLLPPTSLLRPTAYRPPDRAAPIVAHVPAQTQTCPGTLPQSPAEGEGISTEFDECAGTTSPAILAHRQCILSLHLGDILPLAPDFSPRTCMQLCSPLDKEDAGLVMQVSNAISVKRAITDWTSAFCCSAMTSSSSCPPPPAPSPALQDMSDKD